MSKPESAPKPDTIEVAPRETAYHRALAVRDSMPTDAHGFPYLIRDDGTKLQCSTNENDHSWEEGRFSSVSFYIAAPLDECDEGVLPPEKSANFTINGSGQLVSARLPLPPTSVGGQELAPRKQLMVRGPSLSPEAREIVADECVRWAESIVNFADSSPNPPLDFNYR